MFAFHPRSLDEFARLSQLRPASSDSPFVDVKAIFPPFNIFFAPFIYIYSLTPSDHLHSSSIMQPTQDQLTRLRGDDAGLLFSCIMSQRSVSKPVQKIHYVNYENLLLKFLRV